MKTPEERKNAANEYRRILYRERKQWGLCVVCGKQIKDSESKIMCSDCLKTRREWASSRRETLNAQHKKFAAKHKAKGLCAHCNRPAVEGITICEFHRNYYKELRKKRAEQRKKA